MTRSRAAHRDRVRAAYDASAEGRERSWSTPRGWMLPGYEAFERHVGPCRLLDLGCSFGLDSAHFAALGYTVTGVDLSPESIFRARAGTRASAPTPAPALRPAVRFEVADALELDPTQHGPFDAVWASFSLVHVERERLGEALARVAGVLVDPGWLFMAMSDAAETVEEDKPIPGLVDAHGRELAAPIVHWAFGDLQAVTRSAGFELRWSELVAPFPGGGGSLSLWRRRPATAT